MKFENSGWPILIVTRMIDIAKRYLAAVMRHDPAIAPLHPALRSTENARNQTGEGYWRSIERFAGELFFVDTESSQVVMMGVAYHDARPWPFALRLRVEDEKAIESEVVMSTDGKGHFADVEQLLKADIIYDAPVPPARASNRDELSAAPTVTEGLQQSDGSFRVFIIGAISMTTARRPPTRSAPCCRPTPPCTPVRLHSITPSPHGHSRASVAIRCSMWSAVWRRVLSSSIFTPSRVSHAPTQARST
jgi:hypothetical protein